MESEHCHFCQKPLEEPEGATGQLWQTRENEPIFLPDSGSRYALVRKGDVEINVCELCYKAKISHGGGDLGADVHYQFALDYYEWGDYDQALAALTRALKLGITAGSLLTLGNILQAQGRTEDAVTALRMGMLLFSEDPYISSNLSRLS